MKTIGKAKKTKIECIIEQDVLSEGASRARAENVAARQNDNVCILEALPEVLLRMTFEMLPASHLFIAPVCQKFCDVYGAAIDTKKTNKTYIFSLATEAALTLYLDENKERYEDRNSEISCVGAGSGKTDWVERGVINEITCVYAAAGGQLRVLKYLRGRGCPWNKRTCMTAAWYGHLKILMWARKEGCPWDEYTCWGAAEGGHFKTLQWAREQECPWDDHTCEGAAIGGHLEILRWARGEGCRELDESTCEAAAQGGQIEVLRWLRGEGSPWSEYMCLGAAEFGKLETLRWLIKNGCPYRSGPSAQQKADDTFDHDFEEYLKNVADPEFLKWFEDYKSDHPPL